MNRRDFLRGIGCVVVAAGAAGCSDLGSGTPTASGSNTPAETPTRTTTTAKTPEPTDTPTPQQAATTAETDTPESTTTAMPTAETSPIIIGKSTWETEGESVRLLLSNTSEARSGRVSGIVNWYDADDNYLGRDSVSLSSIPPGYMWAVIVNANTAFEPTQFDAFVSATPRAPQAPNDMSVRTANFNPHVPAITGVVENSRQQATSVQVLGQVYNNKWVSHEGIASEGSVPPKTDWRYFIRLNSVSELTELGTTPQVFLSG